MTQPNTTASAPDQPAKPAASGGAGASVATPKGRSKKALLWGATACGVLVVAVLVISSRRPQVPQKLPDPVPSSRVVPIPGVAASVPAPAASDAVALISPLQPPKARPLPAAAAVSLPDAGREVAPGAPADAPTSVNDRQILAALQGNAEALANVEQGIADLKAQLAKMAQVQQVQQMPKRQARTGANAAPVRLTPARGNADTDAAQLLSIDLWGGKPSVVVGRPRGDGTELTFLNEGEKQGRITVKRADVVSQRAVLTTDHGDVVLSREE